MSYTPYTTFRVLISKTFDDRWLEFDLKHCRHFSRHIGQQPKTFYAKYMVYTTAVPTPSQDG